MTPIEIILIWLCCILFNILKINQSTSSAWRMENFGVYAFATLLAPIFLIANFIVVFIFKPWRDFE